MANHEEESFDFPYDCFISFRGEDERYKFVGHLHKGLWRKGIKTFIDDKNMELGEIISSALSKAIEESKVFIIVLSENYVSSKWCLNELVQILKRNKDKKQRVYPIFYHVDPSDVRNQRGSYGKHMIEHETKFGKESQEVQAWRSALSQVGGLPGKHIKSAGDKYEIDWIEEIVEKVNEYIAPKSLHVGQSPVGLESRIEEVMSLLDTKPDDVRMLGIYGLGGIGKTELAKALYNKIVRGFKAASFLADVREKSNKSNGLEDLQMILLSEMKEELETQLGSTSRGIDEIKRRLGQKKVLLVLDDVDDKEQLEKLAGGRDWFGKGSRIIITTRDKDVLSALDPIEAIYEMTELNEQHCLELFCFNAFKQSHPKAGFENMSLRAVDYAKGLPLALKVIGSNLATLREETLEAWECALGEYERTRPHKRIQDVLKISYDSLEDHAQQIFLDIACFFKGDKMEYVKKILEEFGPTSNINELVNKSLLTIESGCLKMHDLIQDVGREIVRKEAQNPGKRSRLWYHGDVIRVLTEDLGSDNIQGIMLDPPEQEKVDWTGTAFEKMKCLRILIVRNTSFICEPKYLPNHLRVLDWEKYPSKSFPSIFYPKDIIVFNLLRSHLKLEERFKKFSRLTIMDFSYNQFITEMPDVSEVQNLRELRLDNCRELVAVDESVGILNRLAHLSASGCTRLRHFLQTMFLPSLEVLDLNTCASLEQFPKITGEMKNPLKIYMINTAIKELPESIGKLTGLVSIDISNSKKLEYLPSSFFMLQNVVSFKIGGCSQLRESFASFMQSPLEDNVRPILRTLHFGNGDLSDKDLLTILNCFPKLEKLIVSENNFVSLPECIKECVHLTSLDVSQCANLQKIPECPNLKILNVDVCVCLKEISELPSTIQKVDARYCLKLTRETLDMLWFQAKIGIGGLEVVMPKSVIPEWFDMVGNGGNPRFWARGGGKFPIFALALVFEDEKAWGREPRHQLVELHLVINGRCVPRKGYYNFKIPPDHILICDVRVLFSDEEWLNLDEFLDHDWNVVQVLYDATATSNLTLTCWGVFAYQEETNRKSVRFTCPDPKYSDIDMSSSTVVVPTKDPKKERKKMIENFFADQMFDLMSVSFSDLHENIKDLTSSQHSENAFKEVLGSQLERYKELSRQAKAELESEGSTFGDKHSLLTSYLDDLNAIEVTETEAETSTSTSGHQGSKEEQRRSSQLSLLQFFDDGMRDGLVEARNNFPSLNIIKTRTIAFNKGNRVEWIFDVVPLEMELYIEGVINALLEAKLSFPDLDVWTTLDLVASRRGVKAIRPFIKVRDVVKAPVDDAGEEKRNNDPRQQQQIMWKIFIDGMTDGLLEARKSFPSLDIVKTRSVASNKAYWIESSLQGNELPLEMRTYTNGIINGLHEAKLSFSDLDMRATLNTVLNRIGIYETPILQFASHILDVIIIILKVGEASTFGHKASNKEEQQEILRKIFYDGMTDGLLEAHDNFPYLDIIKTTSVAINKNNRVQWLFILPQVETKLYIEGIINGLLEAKLNFPYLDLWATLGRVFRRRGMEGLHERIRPLILVMDEASTSGHRGIEEPQQILETIFANGMTDVLFEAQNSFPSLDIIKIKSDAFDAIDKGNWIEVFSDRNLVLPPTVEMMMYMTGVLNGLHHAKLSSPDLDKWATLIAVLSRIGINETLILQYAPRFHIHYRAT